MIALKRILLCTDFSDYSAVATNYACALAEQFDAELHLLHVVRDIMSVEPLPGSYLEDLEKEAIGSLTKVLDPKWEKGRRVTLATRLGPPFLEIIRYAKAHEIDLIVIGTHGRSAMMHVLIGSVAERVVRKAPCPVLTVRPGEHQFVMP